MTALSSTSVTATSAKHHELPRTRLSRITSPAIRFRLVWL